MCNVNCKRLGMAAGAVFVVIFVTDFVLHGILLKDLYHATQHLWRSEANMQSHMPFMIGGQLLASVFLSWIFAKGYEGKGLGEGVRFGVLAAGLLAANCFIWYAVTPLPRMMFVAWLVGGTIQAVLAGVTAAAIYRK